MKEILLTQGKVAFVDDADFEMLNKYKWYAHKVGNTFYATRDFSKADGSQKIGMHRFIMKTPQGKDTDHKDGDSLNNQKNNLRVCTRSENMCNQGKQADNKSGFKGVSWDKQGKKWKATINLNKKQIYLGRFDNKESAYKAYCQACEKYHGEFANYTK